MNETMVEERVSKLEGAYEQVDERLGEMSRSIDSLRTGMNTRFTQMESRFTLIDERFVGVDRSIDSLRGEMNTRLTEMNTRLTQIEGRFTQIDARLNTMTAIMVGSTGTLLVAIIGAVVTLMATG